MAPWQSIVGIGGIVLAATRVGFALGTRRRRIAFAAFAAIAALVPVGGLPLAAYLRGLTGDLSITTVVLLGAGFAGGVEPNERRAISAVVVASALFLYPMALGLGPYDPYRLGFAPDALVWVPLATLAVLAWWSRWYVLLLCVLSALVSHAFGLLESNNLWDYLLDPWVVLASIYDLWSRRRNS